ncbi:hypothetical protein AB0J67_38740, partial [Catellatospora sp. NPDC049609]
MPPPLRRIALTAHVSTSVGWFGAVAAFLAVAVAGLATGDTDRAHGLYVAADVMTWAVIVPLAGASLGSGPGRTARSWLRSSSGALTRSTAVRAYASKF